MQIYDIFITLNMTHIPAAAVHYILYGIFNVWILSRVTPISQSIHSTWPLTIREINANFNTENNVYGSKLVKCYKRTVQYAASAARLSRSFH